MRQCLGAVRGDARGRCETGHGRQARVACTGWKPPNIPRPSRRMLARAGPRRAGAVHRAEPGRAVVAPRRDPLRLWPALFAGASSRRRCAAMTSSPTPCRRPVRAAVAAAVLAAGPGRTGRADGRDAVELLRRRGVLLVSVQAGLCPDAARPAQARAPAAGGAGGLARPRGRRTGIGPEQIPTVRVPHRAGRRPCHPFILSIRRSDDDPPVAALGVAYRPLQSPSRK